MTRNITITEGRPNPDKSIDLWAGHVVGEWQVMPVLSDGDRDPSTDWPVGIIEEWLLERIGDLPETINEARDDPRIYVSDRAKQRDMNRVNLSNNPVACATYDEDDEEWCIEILDDEITVESRPNPRSDEQDRIWLYNETANSASNKREEESRTRRLTAFTGVGEATARKLGDDIHRIDELLNVETGALTDDVQSVVSSQYHDSLRVEVRDWYQKAIRSRSEDDLDSIDRKCLTGDLNWKDSLEDIDATDDVESMCLLFRDVIEPDDQLRITTDTHGEFTAQVVGLWHSEETHVGVEIEPASTPLESQGIIEVPAPYRSEYPVYRYSTNPTDSDPLTGDTIQLVRRVKITKVDRRN
jgi:hypothetical protein